MLIRIGYELRFATTDEVTMITLLNVHPSRTNDLLEHDEFRTQPHVAVERFIDVFGNLNCRLTVPAGGITLCNSTLIRDSGEPDPQQENAREIETRHLPPEVLPFLLNSRYCEVDLMTPIATELFGDVPRGWPRVQAICDWVQQKVTFGYQYASSTRTALDVYTHRIGVCRDFQHLAITFCRALNIPARYATGYLGDIGVPPAPYPMDFSAWFEVYLENRWWTFDARHNTPRIGRILMATGRDATDCAITTTFGSAKLEKFFVVTDEVKEQTAL
jgi:transglutaminase-like putative cysteine protease